MKNSFFVIDTNTLISAILFEHSSPTNAFDKVKQLGKIPASLETYNELCNVIIRPKFDRYASLKIRLEILNEIKDFLILHEITESIQVCRDPKDNKFLELAVSADAFCIITGDKDLLVLNPFRNIPILNAVDFLSSF